MNEEMEDFVQRCLYLQKKIDFMSHSEESPRVWISVLVEMIKNITKDQENSKACIEQIIDVLRFDFEE